MSTEDQEKKGESLKTQQADIEKIVKALGGVLITEPWRYSGQEHATAGFERKRFDQLLKDAGRNLFDAVIVVDPSRWSRDNLKSEEGFHVLRDAGIRFFVGSTEHDLFDPTAELFLGMSTQINQYFSKIQLQKSIRSRVARASRSVPTSGALPYGRTYDKKTETWGIDPEKQKKIAMAAEQFLKGEKLDTVAKMIGLHRSTLWRIFSRSCGDTWEVRFRSPRVRVDETITLNVPLLLSPETVKKLKEKIESGKTYGHGPLKHEYLLARMVFCKKCGYSFFGQANRAGTRYYRHIQKKERACKMPLWCRAEELEEIVLTRLFATVGDAAAMEKAMLKALPDRKKVEEMRERKTYLESELSKVEASRKRLIDSVADGLFSKEDVEVKIKDIRERENLFRTEIEGITEQLSEGPTEEEVRGKAKMLKRVIDQIYRSPSRLAKMSFEERKKLVSTFFAGKDAEGRRLGVYLERNEKTEAVNHEIRGVFGQTFTGTVTPEIEHFKDVALGHVEDLKAAVKVGNAKESQSRSTKDSPHQAKLKTSGKDWRNDPQVEQWVA